ncbi:MAG TPA: DUF151 domain-containing protein [Turneriella sp.]|nr:DUF151 domain-containing protein [Turneriella sp.]
MLVAMVQEVATTAMGYAVIIKLEFKNKIIPVFVGPTEAFAISAILHKETRDRPIAVDLLATLITESKARLEKVFIHDFQGGTFLARIYLTGEQFNKGALELDARPSDALALALRLRSPVYVADHVYDRTAIKFSTVREADNKAIHTDSESIDDILSDDEREEFFEAILEEFGEQKKAVKKTKPAVEKIKFLSRSEALERMLKKALADEQYEEAARIRDELRAESSKTN